MAKVGKRCWANAKGDQTAWVADYFDQNKKRHIKTFATKREATAWLTTASGEVACYPVAENVHRQAQPRDVMTIWVSK